MKKVGIYSGTFDPVHNGHIGFALKSIEKFKLDKVFFLPEPRPRRKQGVKAFEHRTAMLQLAIKPYKKLGLIILNQPRFSAEKTLPVLLERFRGGDLYMLIGDDVIAHLPSWPQVSSLVEKLNFIVALRKNSSADLRHFAQTLQSTNGSKFIYKELELSNNSSSSQIRKKLKQNQSCPELDEKVREYIKTNGLYSSGEK